MTRIAYVNGEFVPLEKASVSVLDRGFLFADGIYEVTAVIDGRMIDNDLHLQRLVRSVGEIDLSLPETPGRIEEIQTDLMRRNALNEGVIYLQVTRGSADRDFAFPREARPTLVMFIQTKNLVDSPLAAKGLSVVTCPDIRWARRDIKSVGLLAQVLAKQMAAAAGCQEAWMLDGNLVTEGSSSTAYIITQDGVIITRPRSTATLPGCTRIALQRLATRRKLKVEERAFSLTEALSAREAFVTSASSLVTAVVEIDGVPIGEGKPGPLVQELRRLYIEAAKATP